MKAADIRQHLVDLGEGYVGEETCDQFLCGEDQCEVRGMVVAWLCTLDLARQAAGTGANLFISHEPIFYEGYGRRDKPGQMERDVARKKEELGRMGLTVLRCHDTWDRYPELGIPDAWAAFLGLSSYHRQKHSFYGKATFAPITTELFAKRILEKVRPLGQQHVEVFQPQATIRSLCIGTGAITNLAAMMDEVEADCYLVTNDGTNTWGAESEAGDRKLPMIRVDHATAELPGIMNLAYYLRETFPEIPVSYLPYPCQYKIIT